MVGLLIKLFTFFDNHYLMAHRPGSETRPSSLSQQMSWVMTSVASSLCRGDSVAWRGIWLPSMPRSSQKDLYYIFLCSLKFYSILLFLNDRELHCKKRLIHCQNRSQKRQREYTRKWTKSMSCGRTSDLW